VANPPASARRTTVRRHTVYGCRLDQQAITRLVRASTDGMTPTVELTTVWNDVEISSGSLDGLRQDIADQLDPGDDRRLENLEIRAVDGERRVTLEIGERAAKITVESTDAAWAIGRTEQLRKILLHAHGSAHLRTWCATRLSVIGLAAAAAGVSCLALAGLLEAGPRSVLLAGLIVVVATIAGYLLGRLRGRRNRTILWIDGPIPPRGWQSWTVAERIAALAFLVALTALVVNVLKW
jgi:hypothetical protein